MPTPTCRSSRRGRAGVSAAIGWVRRVRTREARRTRRGRGRDLSNASVLPHSTVRPAAQDRRPNGCRHRPGGRAVTAPVRPRVPSARALESERRDARVVARNSPIYRNCGSSGDKGGSAARCVVLDAADPARSRQSKSSAFLLCAGLLLLCWSARTSSASVVGTDTAGPGLARRRALQTIW